MGRLLHSCIAFHSCLHGTSLQPSQSWLEPHCLLYSPYFPVVLGVDLNQCLSELALAAVYATVCVLVKDGEIL